MIDLISELARLKLALWIADLLNAAALIGAVVVLLVCWALCEAVYQRIKGI